MMFRRPLISKTIMAAVVLFVGCLGYLQAAPALVSELSDDANQPAAVRVEMPDARMVALAQMVSASAVKVNYRRPNGGLLRTYEIVPFAKVQMFIKGDPTTGKLSELGDFSPFKSALTVRLRKPSSDKMLWFRDEQHPEQWYPVEALGDGKGSFSIKEDPNHKDDKAFYYLLVTSWPAGDPLMGWGPKPN